MHRRRSLILLSLLLLAGTSSFHLSPHQSSCNRLSSRSRIRLGATKATDNNNNKCWNPRLRKVLGGIAGAGVLETAYLTITEISGGSVKCLDNGVSSCSSVLTGPYAQIPGTDVPLAAVGCLAYLSVFGLSLGPVLNEAGDGDPLDDNDDDDSLNRILLTALATTMGVFSVFLMCFLFGVLHESCPYCVASAVFSILLAKLSWLGGALPKEKFKQGLNLSLGGAATALLAAAVLFTGSDAPSVNVAGELTTPPPSETTLLAKANTPLEPQAPPPITTDSTPDSLRLANDLQSLDTSFYGAFWCSHCYDQKQALGKQAMSKIPYVECSRDGANAQVSLCKSKKVPGYPTWEINGKLYPGEQAIEELEEIVQNIKATASQK